MDAAEHNTLALDTVENNILHWDPIKQAREMLMLLSRRCGNENTFIKKLRQEVFLNPSQKFIVGSSIIMVGHYVGEV